MVEPLKAVESLEQSWRGLVHPLGPTQRHMDWQFKQAGQERFCLGVFLTSALTE